MTETLRTLLDREPRPGRSSGRDVEYYEAMRYQGQVAKAERNGRTLAQEEALGLKTAKLRNLINRLATTAAKGGTSEELQAATDAHLATQPLGPVQEGKKRPCRHNTTNKEIGWHPNFSTAGFTCYRCGTNAPAVEFAEYKSADEARNVLKAAGLDLAWVKKPIYLWLSEANYLFLDNDDNIVWAQECDPIVFTGEDTWELA